MSHVNIVTFNQNIENAKKIGSNNGENIFECMVNGIDISKKQKLNCAGLINVDISNFKSHSGYWLIDKITVKNYSNQSNFSKTLH